MRAKQRVEFACKHPRLKAVDVPAHDQHAIYVCEECGQPMYLALTFSPQPAVLRALLKHSTGEG